MEEMINDFCEYLSCSTYKSKEGLYNILKIEETDKLVDPNIITEIKGGLGMYFVNEMYMQSGATKHALDLNNIQDMNSRGISVILHANRLNNDAKMGNITLINCKDNIEKLLTSSGVKDFKDIKIVKDKSYL